MVLNEGRYCSSVSQLCPLLSVALSPNERLVTKYIGRFWRLVTDKTSLGHCGQTINIWCVAGTVRFELEFTRKTALQLLKTAQLQMRGSSFAESAVIGQVNLFWCA